MIPWHPHTETPAEPGTVAIIAVMLGDPLGIVAAMHAHPHLVRRYRRHAP